MADKVERREKTPEDIAFGGRLRSIRELHKLSQAQVAAKVGLSDKAISKYEAGGARPDGIRLKALAQALKCRVYEFFDDYPLEFDNEFLGRMSVKVAEAPPKYREAMKKKMLADAVCYVQFFNEIAEANEKEAT